MIFVSIIIIIIIILKAVFLFLSSWYDHCKNSAGSFDDYRTVPDGCRPSNHAKQLGRWVRLKAAAAAIGIYDYTAWKLVHILTRLTKGRRLSCPRNVCSVWIDRVKEFDCFSSCLDLPGTVVEGSEMNYSVKRSCDRPSTHGCGKSGNIREFDSCEGNTSKLTENVKSRH